MSITQVTEQMEQRQARRIAPYERTYTRVFWVYCNDMLDGPQVALSTFLVPQLFAPYEAGNDIDVFCIVNERTCNIKEYVQISTGVSGPVWEIVVTYSNQTQQPQNPNNEDGFQNPLTRPKILGLTFEKETVVLTKDQKTRQPIVNSAGDPFVPPVTTTRSRPVLTIVRNEDSIDLDRYTGVIDRTNKDSFYGRAVGTVMCRNITSSQEIENNFIYFKTAYEFAIATTGFDIEVENRGYNEYPSGDTTKKRPIVNDAGIAYSQPQFLLSSGAKATTVADSSALTFTPNKSASFGALNLE